MQGLERAGTEDLNARGNHSRPRGNFYFSTETTFRLAFLFSLQIRS
ncbi:hypothetical protein I3760_12G036900 [Carya illinoinensis]|nr:hypothetical protein I3760_12G036900 [Carya illinoinensis]